MIELHPEILVKDGKKLFAVLPYEEFVALQERLADADDLLELRRAKQDEAAEPTVPIVQVKREFGLE